MSCKILVVDDEEVIVKTLSMRLRAAGYEVVVAHDGIQAVEMARKELPNLILMDIMMPNLDGMQASEKIKAIPLIKDTPIIFLTALQTKKGENHNTHANTVLAKPIDHEQLLKLIEEKLEG